MAIPWRALLVSFTLGFPLAGVVPAQDRDGAAVVPGVTDGPTGTTGRVAYVNFNAPENRFKTQFPDTSPRVTLPNPGVVAPVPPPPPVQPVSPRSRVGDSIGAGSANCGARACFDDCCCGPLWTFRADAMFLKRSTPASTVLVTDSFAPGGTVLLNANQFNFPVTAGWDIYVARERLLGEWGVEARYFNVDGFAAAITPVASAGGAVVQFTPGVGNVVNPATVSARFTSTLQNVEINGRREINDWLTLLAGFRYVDLSDQGLRITQQVGNPTTNTADDAINAHNYLAGFQIGLDGRFDFTERFALEVIGKAGIFGNRASNDTSITQIDGPAYASAATASHAAFVGEIDLAGVYKLTNAWAIRGGYQLFWVDGVATAYNQVGPSNPLAGIGGINTSGSVFYQGAFVGLEFRH